MDTISDFGPALQLEILVDPDEVFAEKPSAAFTPDIYKSPDMVVKEAVRTLGTAETVISPEEERTFRVAKSAPDTPTSPDTVETFSRPPRERSIVTSPEEAFTDRFGVTISPTRISPEPEPGYVHIF